MDALSLLPQHHQTEFDSRYRIVLIAAQRAKQLVRGAESEGTSKFTKDTSKALEEVLGGKRALSCWRRSQAGDPGRENG